MKHLLLVPLLGCIVVGFGAPVEDCDPKVFDHCGAKVLSFKEDDGSIAKSLEEYRQHCSRKLQAIKCVRDYSERCLPLEAQQIMDFVLASIWKVAGEKCGEEKMEEYVRRHSSCVVNNVDHLQGCVDSFVQRLNTLLSDTSENKTQKLCCGFFRAQQCTVRGVEGKCNNETVAFVKNTTDLGAKDAARFLCPNFEPSEEACERLEIPSSTDDGGVHVKWNSVFPGILTIITGNTIEIKI